MSDMSHDWSFESFPIETRKCACCGEPFQIASGMIYDDAGDDLAIYVANLADHSGDKRVILHIGLLGKDRKRMKRKKNFVTLTLWRYEGKVVTSVVTDPEDPLGRLMTREEALQSPFISLLFEIKDFILENDPYIRPFLDDDSTPEAPEEKQE